MTAALSNTITLNGTEVIYVLPVQANGRLAAETAQTTTAAIAGLASSFQNDSPTAITATTGTTFTAAQLLTGLINRTGPTANFTDTTDTAANIVAALGGVVGQSFYIDIKNATAFTETLAGGTGITFSSSSVILPNSIAEFLVTITSATAAVFNHVFTTAISPLVSETSTSLATVGAGTITGAGIVGGLVVRSGSQSNTAFTDTTDTAANIIAAQINAHIGISWLFTYQNSTNVPATITGGTGVTVSGTTVVPANTAVCYLITYTAANTITMQGFMSGAAPAAGTFTANGATPVTVANTAFGPNSVVAISLKTVGGTVGVQPHLLTTTPGTGFTVSGTASDTSIYNYSITG